MIINISKIVSLLYHEACSIPSQFSNHCSCFLKKHALKVSYNNIMLMLYLSRPTLDVNEWSIVCAKHNKFSTLLSILQLAYICLSITEHIWFVYSCVNSWMTYTWILPSIVGWIVTESQHVSLLAVSYCFCFS